MTCPFLKFISEVGSQDYDELAFQLKYNSSTAADRAWLKQRVASSSKGVKSIVKGWFKSKPKLDNRNELLDKHSAPNKFKSFQY